jgi:hypothetical protein
MDTTATAAERPRIRNSDISDVIRSLRAWSRASGVCLNYVTIDYHAGKFALPGTRADAISYGINRPRKRRVLPPRVRGKFVSRLTDGVSHEPQKDDR